MHVFLDTMIFIHCVDMEAIDFCDFFKVDAVTVVVPRITIRELDGHKTYHSSRRTRDRSRQTLKLLEKLAERNYPIRSNVQLELMSCLPNVDFEENGLHPLWNDDQLIASALTYSKLYPDRSITVISHDTGVRLKCKNLGIRAVELPQKYWLPPELDRREEKIRTLQRQIQRMESALPKLVLDFAGTKETAMRFQVRAQISADENVIQEKLQAARQALPQIEPKEVVQNPLGIKFAQSLEKWKKIPASEFKRYGDECETYLYEMERFERLKINYENMRRRLIRFTIEISNVGNAPAKDIDINIYFPDGFELFEEDNVPNEPAEPKIPLVPMSEIERTFGSIRNFPIELNRTWEIPNLDRPVSNFRLKKSNSYELTDHIPSIKHGFKYILPELFLMFSSYETARSFHCDYNLLVGNLSDPVTGKLHFIIETEAAGG